MRRTDVIPLKRSLHAFLGYFKPKSSSKGAINVLTWLFHANNLLEISIKMTSKEIYCV